MNIEVINNYEIEIKNNRLVKRNIEIEKINRGL